MFLLDHLFVLDPSMRPSATDKKSFYGELSDLGVELFNIRFSGGLSFIEDVWGFLQKDLLPLK